MTVTPSPRARSSGRLSVFLLLCCSRRSTLQAEALDTYVIQELVSSTESTLSLAAGLVRGGFTFNIWSR
jgi:hypothetical protein